MKKGIIRSAFKTIEARSGIRELIKLRFGQGNRKNSRSKKKRKRRSRRFKSSSTVFKAPPGANSSQNEEFLSLVGSESLLVKNLQNKENLPIQSINRAKPRHRRHQTSYLQLASPQNLQNTSYRHPGNEVKILHPRDPNTQNMHIEGIRETNQGTRNRGRQLPRDQNQKSTRKKIRI